MDGNLLLSVFIFLCAACLLVPISTLSGLGSVIGYLIAGVRIGPSVLGLISDPITILHFAEFGVVMMLFLIGLELQPRKLWAMRGKLVGIGQQISLQGPIVFSIGAALARAGNGANSDLIVHQSHQYFRARADDLEIAVIKKEHEG